MNPESYVAVAPCPELRPFIRRFMVANPDGLANAVMRPVATGYSYLGWVHGGSLRIAVDGRPLGTFRGLVLFGQIKNQEIEITCMGRVPHVLAEFTATGMYRLVHTSGDVMLGRGAQLEDVSPRPSCVLYDVLGTRLADMEGHVAAFETALLACAERAHEAVDYVEQVAAAIERVDGGVSISALCREVAVSDRQMTRRYREIVGIGPKYFAKVLRANNAFQQLLCSDAWTLTRVAQDLGFYDQAHFGRSIRDIFGCTPTDLMRFTPTILADFLNDSRRFSCTGSTEHPSRQVRAGQGCFAANQALQMLDFAKPGSDMRRTRRVE